MQYITNACGIQKLFFTTVYHLLNNLSSIITNTGQATQPESESMFTINLQLQLHNTPTAGALNCLWHGPWIACVHVEVAPSCDYTYLQMWDLDGVWRSINLSSRNLSCIEKRLELHNGRGMGVTVSGIRAGEKIQKLTGSTTSLAGLLWAETRPRHLAGKLWPRRRVTATWAKTLQSL